MVLDRIVIYSSIIMDDTRRSTRILLGDEKGASSIRTLRGADTTSNKHLFKEIDEGIEAIVWDLIVTSIDVLVRIFEANTVPRNVRVGFDVPQFLNEDVSILFVDFRSDLTYSSSSAEGRWEGFESGIEGAMI